MDENVFATFIPRLVSRDSLDKMISLLCRCCLSFPWCKIRGFEAVQVFVGIFQLLGEAAGASSVDGAPRNAQLQEDKRGTGTKLFFLVGSVLI